MTSDNKQRCTSCNVAFVDHLGIIGICREKTYILNLLRFVVSQEMDKYSKIQVPIHDCDFLENPESGHCETCHMWTEALNVCGFLEEDNLLLNKED